MQIGPRIRIGGSLGKAGNKLKRGVRDVASNPFVQGGLGFLTGGATIPLLAGALGGGLKEKAGLGDVLGGAGQGFAAGSAGKFFAPSGGFGGAAGAIGEDAALDVAGSEPLAEGGRFRSVGKALKKGAGWVKEHGDDIKSVGKTAEELWAQKRAYDEDRRNAPLRDRSRALVMDESRPDLSGVFDDPNAPTRFRRVRG